MRSIGQVIRYSFNFFTDSTFLMKAPVTAKISDLSCDEFNTLAPNTLKICYKNVARLKYCVSGKCIPYTVDSR